MGFLDRTIKRAVNNAVNNVVGNAVEQAVTKTVAPAVNNAVNTAVDGAATKFNASVGNTYTPPDTSGVQVGAAPQSAQTQQAAATLGGMFSTLQTASVSFANEAAKNMKICPACGEGAAADKKFCPACGAKLPEETLAQGAVCTSCGKQNEIGVKFCSECGAKLPAAIAEEQAARSADEAVLARWDRELSGFPKWCFGGREYGLETQDSYAMFSVYFNTNSEARANMDRYMQYLRENGFRPAGEYADPLHLYGMAGGRCCHVDFEHCFDGDDNCMILNLSYGEPQGGFDYVKPERKNNDFDLGDLKKGFGDAKKDLKNLFKF